MIVAQVRRCKETIISLSLPPLYFWKYRKMLIYCFENRLVPMTTAKAQLTEKAHEMRKSQRALVHSVTRKRLNVETGKQK